MLDESQMYLSDVSQSYTRYLTTYYGEECLSRPRIGQQLIEMSSCSLLEKKEQSQSTQVLWQMPDFY